jgi:hypothetical protein
MALTIPGITWQGARDAATQELAIRVDGAWMHALTAGEPMNWWDPLCMTVPSDPGIEATRLPIDFEDLADFEEDVGPVVAKEPKRLQSVLIPRKPWRKSRSIQTQDLTRNNFAGWPDRLAQILLSSRRMNGALARELLFQATTNVKTYQGVALIGTGHLTDPTDAGSATFDNLHTSSDFDAAGWEAAQDAVFGRLGPGGYGLDLKITHVIGGTAMRKKFDRQFKRTIVLEDSANNDAAAGVTNIHSTMIEGGVVPIVTSQLDRHPWLIGAGVGKDHWFTVSTTYAARPLGIVAEGGGAPTVKILDVGSEYETLNNAILIIARMALNGGGAFPHTIDEWRGS